MCHWKNHVLFSFFKAYYCGIRLWCFIWLTWRMLKSCYDYTSHLKPLWSFSFWLVISLYALINNVLSLCMIMVIIALLVGRSQSFASLRLYWVWTLLVHPTIKNRSLPIMSTIHTYMWYFTATPKWIACLLPLNLQKLLHVLCFVLAHEEVLNALSSLSCLFWLHTLTSMHNVLVLNIAKEQARVPSPLNINWTNNLNLLTLCTWEIMNLACLNKGEEELYCSLYGSRSWSH